MIDLRFWSKVTVGGADDCWPWTGSRHEKGYGHFWEGGKIIRAHRKSWIYSNGPIPKGKQVLHSCDNPPCVNPKHLFLGTNQDNCKDCGVKRRHWTITKGMSEAHIAALRAGARATKGKPKPSRKVKLVPHPPWSSV